MNLTDHFTPEEFLRSQTAARMGRVLVPPPEVIANLKRLCILGLEPLRIALGRSVIVSSGWRPTWLNTLIGGAPGSAHVDGRAADTNTVGMSPRTFARFIQRQCLPFDKVILEFPDSSSGGWVHLQVAKEGVIPRQLYRTARHVNGQTQYIEGLV